LISVKTLNFIFMASPPSYQALEQEVKRLKDQLQAKEALFKGIFQERGSWSVDISGKRKPSDALAREKRRWQVLFEHTGTATCIFNRDGLIVLCNREFEKLTGYSKTDIEARMHWRDFVAHWDLERMEKYHERRQLTDVDVPQEYEFCLITSGQKIRNIYLKIGMIRETQERVASLTDITSLKNAEVELKESYKLFSSFMDQIPHVVFIKDTASRMVYVNQHIKEKFHAHEWLGKKPQEIFSSSEAEKLVKDDQKVLNSGFEEVYDRIVDVNGQEHHYQTYKFVIRGTGRGSLIGAIGLDITQRMRYREELKKSEQTFHKLYNSTSTGIAFVSSDEVISELNGAFGNMLGLSIDQMHGKPLWDFVQTDREAQWLREQMRQSTIDQHRMEMQFIHQDQRTIYGLMELNLIRDGNRQPLYYIVQVIDITDQKMAQVRSQESNRQLQTLIGNLPGMAYRCLNREDWFMLFMSQGCQRITGYPPEHFIYNKHTSYGDMIHPDDKAWVWQQVQQAVEEGRPFEMEYRILSASGAVRRVWERGQSVGADQQGRDMLEGFIMDVTTRAKAQRDLRESEERYKNLFETTGTATIVYDQEKVIRMCNRKFEELYGLPRSQIIGLMKWSQFVHPDDLPRMQEYHRLRGRGSEKPPVEYDFKLVDARGQVKTVHHVVKFLEGSRQRIASFSDITALKQAEEHMANWNRELEEKVRQRTAQLEETNRELESFSYSVSHDLKAPLRAIEGFSKILMRQYTDTLDDAGKRYLEITRQNASKMNQLISDLLSFSRLGRKALQIKKNDLNALVADVYREQKQLFHPSPCRFECQDLPPVMGDRSMIKVVFSNLLSNAFKFYHPDRMLHVNVGAYQQDGHTIFFVRDNGVGFDMKYAGKLFDAFQRLHREERYSGSGIGLSLVQRVIHKHGGRIWAESRIGEQTTFYFYLGNIEND